MVPSSVSNGTGTTPPRSLCSFGTPPNLGGELPHFFSLLYKPNEKVVPSPKSL